MNGLDIFLIIMIIILVILGLIGVVVSIYENEPEVIIGIIMVELILCGLLIVPFIVLDRGSGYTLGTITSVDKNFFGTTAIYVKTSETDQEKYCIENKELSELAVELIGKKVKIKYGERIGFYSTGKCSQAPIESIEIIDE